MKNDAELSRQRNRLLVNLERLLEGPMITLGFIWLLLLILDLSGNSNKSLEQIFAQLTSQNASTTNANEFMKAFN